MKKLLKVILILLLIAVIAVGGLFGFLTVTEYKPADIEALEPRVLDSSASAAVPADSLSVLSWNIGYAGLGKEQDFFMDGGSHARPGSAELVNRYLAGIKDSIVAQGADLVLLQEVDTNASRTYGIDETTALIQNTGVHALNYSCPFVPIPFPPMGKVHSGLFTTTDYAITEAERIALPCPFSWPPPPTAWPPSRGKVCSGSRRVLTPFARERHSRSPDSISAPCRTTLKKPT